MTMGPIQKTFPVLRPFEGAPTCSFLIAELMSWSEKRISLGEGPGKRPNPGLLGHGSLTLRLLETHSNGRIFQNFSSLGALPAEK
jgi:hypothetical protein